MVVGKLPAELSMRKRAGSLSAAQWCCLTQVATSLSEKLV